MVSINGTRAASGTAGLVVAGRLAENPDVKILVIEAGVGNPEEIADITTPSSAMSLRGGKHDWTYRHQLIDAPDYKRVENVNTRGKVLGGSSSLNYFTWLPCSGAIYDEWAQYGGEGWNYKNVRKYFQKPVTFLDDEKRFSAETAAEIGTSGPLKVAPAELVEELAPFRNALETAWVSTGNKMQEDIYSGHVGGLVPTTNTIYHGNRSNCVVFVRGNRKIVVEDKVAVGILTESQDGIMKIYRAKREVIISEGVFESPKLLLLSGIGPKKELAAHDINLLIESPHVGQNLIDHPIFPHVFRLKEGYGADSLLLHQGSKLEATAELYKKPKTGAKASGLLELAGFPPIIKTLILFVACHL